MLKVLEARIELATLCVWGTRDNQLHHPSNITKKKTLSNYIERHNEKVVRGKTRDIR